jgi:hypothetical protein
LTVNTADLEPYYHILEISPGASESEIKKAYRRLARKYHPDVSNEENAQERFLEITEAYQNLIEKPGSRRFIYDTVVTHPNREEQRRERARQYARMRYEEFKKSNLAFQKAWYYMPAKILTYLIVYCLYIAAALLFLAPVIAWIITRNKFITIMFAFFILISSHVFSLGREIYKGTKAYFSDWEE